MKMESSRNQRKNANNVNVRSNGRRKAQMKVDLDVDVVSSSGPCRSSEGIIDPLDSPDEQKHSAMSAAAIRSQMMLGLGGITEEKGSDTEEDLDDPPLNNYIRTRRSSIDLQGASSSCAARKGSCSKRHYSHMGLDAGTEGSARNTCCARTDSPEVQVYNRMCNDDVKHISYRICNA